MNLGPFATKSKAALVRSARFLRPWSAEGSSAGLQTGGQVGSEPNPRLRSRGPGCCAHTPRGVMPRSDPSSVKNLLCYFAVTAGD